MSTPGDGDPSDVLAGRNAVREALEAGRGLRRLLVAEGTRGTEGLIRAARAAGVRVDRLPRAALDARAGGTRHQGVVAEVEPFVYRSWRLGLSKAAELGGPPLVLGLDGVTDPRNLGSLLRSAEAAGCHAVVLPARRAAPITAVVEKTAAGAAAHLIIDRVSNLARWIDDARSSGLWVVALDPKATDSLFDNSLLMEPLALIVGAEGPGVSRLVGERADLRVRIPLAGRIGSLNAGVAGAVALFEVLRMRRAKEAAGSRRSTAG